MARTATLEIGATVIELYEGVDRRNICNRCITRRPFGRYGRGRPKVRLIQMAPDAKIHLERFEHGDRLGHTICGINTR